MFQRRSERGYIALLPGVQRKTLVYGEKTLMAEFLLERGKRLPRHSHPHEQTGYLVKGRIILSIGPEENELNPGDSWCIPAGVEHEAGALEDSVALEVFSPAREDYLPEKQTEPG